MIDWSGRNSLTRAVPTKEAIWVGELLGDGEGTEAYMRGRAHAAAHVRDRLRDHIGAGRRVLVGFDFPYGYPAGFAEAAGLPGASPWRAVWDHLGDEIADDDRNRSNRFAVAAALNRRIAGGPGPFWGCPAATAGSGLTATTKGLFEFPFTGPRGTLERLRMTERGTPGVQEAWKLLGAGSVGSQALLGIPRVRTLRDDPGLSAVSAVWPFETGFTSAPTPENGPFALHAEIWPGITGADRLDAEVSATGAIRDEAQVRLMCRWAAERDRTGVLGRHFDRPAGLADAEVATIVAEEGWILS